MGSWWAFGENPEVLIDKAQAFGLELGSAVGSGQVQISYRLPVDLVFDAVMAPSGW